MSLFGNKEFSKRRTVIAVLLARIERNGETETSVCRFSELYGKKQKTLAAGL